MWISGQEELLQLEDLDVPFPDPHGQVVGHEQALRGEVDDLLAEGPYLGSLRKRSPQEMCTRSGSWPSTIPCVPFPLPGMPNRRTVRYFRSAAMRSPSARKEREPPD